METPMATSSSYKLEGGGLEDDIEMWQADQEDRERYKSFWARGCCYPVNYLLFLSVIGAASTFLLYGLVPLSLHSLRVQYKLSHSALLVLPILGDVAAAITILKLSFWAGRGRPRRWVAPVAFLTALGALFFALPHLISNPYVATVTEGWYLCKGAYLGDCVDVVEFAYPLFIVGIFLMTTGLAMILVLGPALLHTNTPKDVAAGYMGIWFAFVVAGVILALLIGDSMSEVWVQFPAQSPPMPSTHWLWVNAWWLGFVVVAALLAVIALSVSFFPDRLPRYASWTRERNELAFRDEINDGTRIQEQPDDADVHHPFPVSPNGVRDAWAPLYASKTFRYSLLAQSFEDFALVGMVVYLEPFTREMFQLETNARSAVGTSLMVGAVSGAVLGGFLIKRLRLTTVQVARMSWMTVAASVLLLVFTLIPKCELHESSPMADSTCSSECQCSPNFIMKVCDVTTQQTFLSPCQAGCMGKAPNGSYTGCCASPSGVLEAGPCQGPCNSYKLFLVFASFFAFFSCLNLVPATALILRSIPTTFHHAGLGFRTFVFLVLGFIPSYLIFGSFFSSSCERWAEGRCGYKGECMSMNQSKLRTAFFLGSLIPKLVSTCFFYMAYSDYKKRYKRHAKAVEITMLEQQRMMREREEVTNNQANAQRENSVLSQSQSGSKRDLSSPGRSRPPSKKLMDTTEAGGPSGPVRRDSGSVRKDSGGEEPKDADCVAERRVGGPRVHPFLSEEDDTHHEQNDGERLSRVSAHAEDIRPPEDTAILNNPNNLPYNGQAGQQDSQANVPQQPLDAQAEVSSVSAGTGTGPAQRKIIKIHF
eukprot:gb/GEZN01002078.1/.p1 GENE.gb/GEZN01002078.1/~~gb/GEZN01002078.1/.p1  ORF type:complete len:819 (-),score=63.16 gb/GEZN01002078.1/:170-2626(-)